MTTYSAQDIEAAANRLGRRYLRRYVADHPELTPINGTERRALLRRAFTPKAIVLLCRRLQKRGHLVTGWKEGGIMTEQSTAPPPEPWDSIYAVEIANGWLFSTAGNLPFLINGQIVWKDSYFAPDARRMAEMIVEMKTAFDEMDKES